MQLSSLLIEQAARHHNAKQQVLIPLSLQARTATQGILPSHAGSWGAMREKSKICFMRS